MKEFIKSILPIIGAVAVSVLQLPIGFVYSLGYSIVMTLTLKDWKSFFKFWIRFVDGVFATAGYIIYHVAEGLDRGWNVNGEILEDMMTAEEDTTFSDKNITVSASIGKLEKAGKLNRFGKWFSRLLNLAFQQKQHALDAWEWTQARAKLKSKYFEKL